jgi:two-component system cell cycle sensor histidine kinase/response regulator CckA
MIEEVAPKFPRVKVVFISGYAEDVFVKSYGSEREFNFLPKPFTLKQLASKVKEVMAK